MRHKTIINIQTRIRKKRQYVLVEFENKEFVFLSTNNIRQNTSLEVHEIELLIGSKLRIDFYKKGEKMFNNAICEKDNIIVKDFYFELEKSVEHLRKENIAQLLPFKKIAKIFYFNKFNRENVGIEDIDKNVIFMTLKRFEFQSQISKDEQHILIGSYILPEYYKKGDTFSDGTIVKKDKALKWINLRYSGNVEQMHEEFENRIGYFEAESYYDKSEDEPGAYGYKSWNDMALHEAFEGDASNYWNID